MFHVLYSGDFKDSIANLLDNGHHSLSILGPFAHVHTLIQIAAHKTPFNNHFPTATYSSNRSSVRLVPRDFLRGSPTFETLLVEAGKGKRLTVLKGKPYFRISNSGLYRHKKPPRRYDTSIVFGSGLDLDLGVKIHSIRRRLGDLLKLMINEYKHAIMAALVAGSEVQALYLQPLVDPNDRVLFKLSLSALGSAISELSESLKLIPVKLMLPLLSTRAFHLTYEKDMIKALREHISPRSTVTIEKIGFSEEKQQFITHYTKSGPRRQRPDLK